MRHYVGVSVLWTLMTGYVLYMCVCGGCSKTERAGQLGDEVQVFDQDWTADGLVVGSRKGELYSFELRDGVFAVTPIEVQGNIVGSSGARCANGTLLAGLDASGQQVSDLYYWAGHGAAAGCGVSIGSSYVAGVDCDVIAISQGVIKSVAVAPDGNIELREDVAIEEPASVAVGRRILADHESMLASATRGGILEIDRVTGKIVSQVSDSDGGMPLLFGDDRYIIQGTANRIVFRKRSDMSVERGVAVPGIPVGVIRATANGSPSARYFVVVRYDDVLECDIIDMETMKYVRVPKVSAINIVQ